MAATRLLALLAYRAIRASKKLIAAVGRHVLDGGEYPDELRDLDLCERFGWTLGELDDQDMARVLPGIVAQNVRASLSRLNTFLGTLGRVPPSKDDMEVYGWVKRMMTEAEAGDDG